MCYCDICRNCWWSEGCASPPFSCASMFDSTPNVRTSSDVPHLLAVGGRRVAAHGLVPGDTMTQPRLRTFLLFRTCWRSEGVASPLMASCQATRSRASADAASGSHSGLHSKRENDAQTCFRPHPAAYEWHGPALPLRRWKRRHATFQAPTQLSLHSSTKRRHKLTCKIVRRICYKRSGLLHEGGGWMHGPAVP